MDTVKFEDGIDKCWCRRCEVWHDCTQHYINRKSKTGYSYICKAKTKNYYKEPEVKAEVIVKMESERILKKLGYNLESSIPVHEQFLIKHDL